MRGFLKFLIAFLNYFLYWFIYNKLIPNAFDYNQDYDFSTVNESKRQSVIVPSSLVMQGFDIENNT